MASVTRIIGPEFVDTESQGAFERISETIRQYTVHSRETVVLIRNPLTIPYDHFVVLWSRGASIVTMLHRGGKINGQTQRTWSETIQSENANAERHFENPLPPLTEARSFLVRLLEQFRQQHQREEDPESDDIAAARNRAIRAIKSVIVFTRPVTRLEIADLSVQFVIGTTLDHITSRTIFHLPNLLRITDSDEVLFGTIELQQLSTSLLKEAERNILSRESRTHEPLTLTRVRRSLRSRRGVGWAIGLFALALATVIAFILIVPGHPPPPPKTTVDSSARTIQPKQQRQSSVIIILQQPEQLYVSASKFDSRSELDQAIANGEGVRSFPTDVHELTLDSALFAHGVYGYFKVQNTWRKGKLLQTFNLRDTFRVDNFLPPLP